jgi:disulfide bond formation protein DsbB
MTETVATGPVRSPGLSAPTIARWIALLLPVGLLGGAMGSQYLGGLIPCEMCIWQRWPHAGAILLAALAFTAPADAPRSRRLVVRGARANAKSGAHRGIKAGVEAGIF